MALKSIERTTTQSFEEDEIDMNSHDRVRLKKVVDKLEKSVAEMDVAILYLSSARKPNHQDLKDMHFARDHIEHSKVILTGCLDRSDEL
ncbi:hypothetical protein [Cohnella sp. AR92]|uniref:hypothetical protein n=1 Tax=Cohnella sp. AR92 TaxID=648716 RepID=UPI000F8E9395|nr:hypothetical protein [Cohnella sp. AR92]RUS44901.1 hypothetical protein ELR57_21835 [Cohnella sp. AR92]